ncbi:uncharacterized protein BBA_05157 [Beauveria bassiana ARSEF 2860]|uniref:Uncharacterized protein n=1 Tax=Beauveria bassiana (strain ARSEF 2860) TaxID=655819 RepID=J5JT21_BEAB2|nr:uncharacterized protein BBA_05157 [Beauveria bassiana ARSEF 2860]EJP65746.1 hypothetical protein BBA_05157 [Beauveria bassiana ARSEF 2860]
MRSYLALTVVLFTLGVWSQDCGSARVVQTPTAKPFAAAAAAGASRATSETAYAGACIPMDQCPSGGVSDDEQLEPREWRGVNVPGSCWRNSCAEKK